MRYGESMSITKKIISFLKSLKFQKPSKAPVLVFDPSGSEAIISFVLPGMDFAVLPVRNEFFYLSPRLLFRMIKNFNLRAFFYGQKIISICYQSYLYTIIEWVEPAVVITYTDNNPSFQWLSRNYPFATFYAVQNGVRNKYDLYDSLKNPDQTIRKMSMTNFICFGQNDEKNYKQYGHEIDHFYSKGSLKGSYFQSCIKKNVQTCHYDICFVSQYRHEIFKKTSFPAFKNASGELFKLLKKYIEHHHPVTCIALSTSSEDEKEFYSEIFGDLVTLIPQDNSDCFSTYRAMDCSETIVTLSSTAALEAFGWGKKVLFCNYFENYEIAELYQGGLCSITQKEYKIFEKTLSRLCTMKKSEYEEITCELREYMMAYDPNEPLHIFLRKLIADSIESK